MSLHETPSTSDGPHLRAGRAALARGAWDEARAHFESALADAETPEAHEGRAYAAMALLDVEATLRSHERAYTLQLERGDRRAAARLALWLAWDARVLRGDAAVSDGWFERAREMLNGLEEGPEHGWLAVREVGLTVLARHDVEGARARARRALAIAREHGEVALEMEALAVEGVALVRAGEVAEGMRRLDQAAAATAAGEVGEQLSAGNILCQVLSAYERARDFDRAAQWYAVLETVNGRHHVRPLASMCRTHLASLLIERGRWREAEETLAPAPHHVPSSVAAATVQRGELRLRQGRLDEAEELFDREPHLPAAQLGLAALALERGDARAACDLVERHLRSHPDCAHLDRARGLALAARARVALGDLEGATRAAEALRATAERTGTTGLRAAALRAEGEVALARGDHECARRRFEDATDTAAGAGLPFESAESRLALARTLRAQGRPEAAHAEAARARQEFATLGAAARAAAAQALERDTAPAAPEAERPPLSEREIEVLRLVAQGLSNKEVAARLFLSEHTIKRHLANILGRLGLPSRAAAVAHASRLGLL